MIRLSPARRREEEFARLIEGSRADSPLTAPTSDLVELARSLRALPLTPRGPDPRFRADLRSRLLDEPGPAAAVPARAHRARSPQRSTALRVAAAAVLGVGLGVTGTASASQGALPGEPLYLVKRGVESVRLTLTPNPVDKGKLHLQHAERRSSEVEALLRRGAAERPASLAVVESTLEALESDTRRGSELLLTPGGAADPSALTTLRSFVDGEQAWLDRLEPELPQDLQPDVDPLADLLTVLDEEVEDRAVATPAPATSTPASPAVTGGSPPRVERPASVPAPAPLITKIPASPTDRGSPEAVLPADRPSRATPSSPSVTPTPARSARPSATSTAPRINAPKTSEPSVRAEPSETSEPSTRPSPARSTGTASSSAARTSPGTSSARRSLAPAGSGAPSEPTSGVRPTASAARSTTTGPTPSGTRTSSPPPGGPRTSSPPPGSSTAETRATATGTTSASAR